jgi:hypothetical protein
MWPLLCHKLTSIKRLSAFNHNYFSQNNTAIPSDSANQFQNITENGNTREIPVLPFSFSYQETLTLFYVHGFF